MGTTQNTTENLTAAIARLDAGKAYWMVTRYLSDDAYDLATRASENLHGVGLTGLCEDIRDGHADYSDLRDALATALNVTLH